MALSKITASKIVDAVSNDAESRRRVNSWTGSGVVRNFAMANAPWMDPTDRSSNAYKWSCDGIAEATTAAINTALKKDPPQIPDVDSVTEQAREEGFSHTATAITMKDGTRYVFDWWKTLEVNNPCIFRYNDFMKNRGNDVVFNKFTGWP